MINSEVALRRLSSQRIHHPIFDLPEEVVRWMGALQAQDYAQAVWAVGLRTRSAALADIEQALIDKKIIRTWPMRGTIHFVPSEDAKWMVGLSAARMTAADGRRQEQLGLDVAILERSKQLFYDALSGGKSLSRPEMMSLLNQAGIQTVGQRGYHILWYAAQTGLIGIGPMKEKQQTFVLLEDWAPNSRVLTREEALAELASRYFASHGPATIHDFAWWAGITVKDARSGQAAVKPGLISETLNGKEYWMTGKTVGNLSQSPVDVHLLPGFDEYFLGYTDRSLVLLEEHAQKVVPGNNGVFKPMIVVDGQVVGVWKRALKKNAVEIVLSPFWTLDIAEERLIEAAQRFSGFLGLPLSATTIEEI